MLQFLFCEVLTNMNDVENGCRIAAKCVNGLLTQNLDDVIAGHAQLVLPRFSHSFLLNLCDVVDEIFASEPAVLDLEGPVVIVGDLHGHLLDLLRIFLKFQTPPNTNYLLLGDIIDRGDFSLETLTIIYAYKVLFPERIHIIRGNHEFLSVSSNGTFPDEISSLYPRSKLYNKFIDSFQNMPLAAVLNKNILCIHGGISPDFMSIEQLREIKRPIDDFKESTILSGLLWSDPTRMESAFAPSRRKSGFLFGVSVFNTFMEQNKLSKMVRGHECVSGGYAEMFDGRLITVFSASNYCNASQNKAAVLILNSTGLHPLAMLPLGYAKRCNARFVNAEIFCQQFGGRDRYGNEHQRRSSASSASTGIFHASGTLVKISGGRRPLYRVRKISQTDSCGQLP